DLGLSNDEILTVAGHDSINMKEIVPTVMLFVPSVEGISHNEGEFTSEADMLAGLATLTEVVRRLAHGSLS
ncbi:M20/M25/M40 family metallo-hydrolase, partial [Agrococcus casei]